jgi:hypothetical protein
MYVCMYVHTYYRDNFISLYILYIHNITSIIGPNNNKFIQRNLKYLRAYCIHSNLFESVLNKNFNVMHSIFPKRKNNKKKKSLDKTSSTCDAGVFL